MQPKVSVVMSVYNGARYVKEAVDSILTQTFPDFEFIIIDDGSTDNTWLILRSYADSRIRLIQNEQNIGLTRSLNRGLAVARGIYIARIDADDISLPSRLEQQVRALDANPDLGLVGSNIYVLFDASRRRRTIRHPQTDLEIRWRLLFNNSFTHSSVMFRRNLIEKAGPYDETIAYAQDYEFFSRVAEHCKVKNLTSPLVVWRLHDEGQTSVTQSEQQMAAAASVSHRNIKRLLGRASRNDAGLVYENLWALWSIYHPPLSKQSPKQVVECVQGLFLIFCELYQPSAHAEKKFQANLAAIRRSTMSRLFSHAAVRYYRQQEMAMAWWCFFQSLLSGPTAITWRLLSRLILLTLLGGKLFGTLKDRCNLSKRRFGG